MFSCVDRYIQFTSDSHVFSRFFVFFFNFSIFDCEEDYNPCCDNNVILINIYIVFVNKNYNYMFTYARIKKRTMSLVSFSINLMYKST